LSPARFSTSRKGTPVHSATPIAPNFHCPPSAFFPYRSSKKLRPFPAHSTNRVTETDGRARISLYVNSRGLDTPEPSTRSRHDATSTRAVRLWLRTKNNSFGTT